jgi:ABC-2 type transport system permease protein
MNLTRIDIGRVKALVQLQWQEFKRDRGTLFLSFVFPVLFVAGLFLQDMMNPSFQFKFGVVEAAQRDASGARFVQLLTDSPSVGIKPMRADEVDAALKDGTVHAVLTLPAGDVFAAGQAVKVQTSPRYEELVRILLDAASARRAGPEAGIHYKVQLTAQAAQSEMVYVFPGILAMALVQLGLFATAVPLLQARDRGTLRYLLLTPARPLELLLSQVSLRVCVAVAQMVFLLGAGMWLLKLGDVNWAAVAGAAVLGVLLLVSIGYAIAGVAPSLQTGMSMVMVANFALLFGGNIFWDPNTSKLLMTIAHIVPLSYLSDLFRQLITGAKGIWPMWMDVAVILAWSGVAIAIASRTLRFDTVDRGPRPVAQPA